MIDQSYPVLIRSTLADYQGEINGEDLTLTINFVNCTVAQNDVVTPEVDDLDFQIGDLALEVPFDAFQSTDATFCNYEWTYTLLTATDPVGGADIAAYVTVQQTSPPAILFHADHANSNGIQAQDLQVVLLGYLDNGQVFSTSFFVTFTDAPVSGYEIDQNIQPEFKEEIETHFLIDFGDEYQEPQEFIMLGQLSDHEDDNFIIVTLNEEDLFANQGYDK